MKQNIIIILLLIVIGLLTFLCITATKNNNKAAITTIEKPESLPLNADSINFEAPGNEKLKSFFLGDLKSSYLTGPITSDSAQKYIDYFDNSVNVPLGNTVYPGAGKRLVPTATWIDIRSIRTLFMRNDFDGIRVYPIRYSDNATDRVTGARFNKNEINYMFVFTKSDPANTDRHVDDFDYAYDYNHPCPNPPCGK